MNQFPYTLESSPFLKDGRVLIDLPKFARGGIATLQPHVPVPLERSGILRGSWASSYVSTHPQPIGYLVLYELIASGIFSFHWNIFFFLLCTNITEVLVVKVKKSQAVGVSAVAVEVALDVPSSWIRFFACVCGLGEGRKNWIPNLLKPTKISQHGSNPFKCLSWRNTYKSIKCQFVH